MKGKLTVAGLIMLIGGAITFLFSFLSFIKYGSEGRSAWSNDLFALFPNTTIIALLGLAAAVVGVLELVGQRLPEPVLTFTWKQIRFTWGVVTTAFMLAYLITDKGGADLGIGAIFMLLGSIALLVGATLDLLGKGDQVLGGGAKAASPGSAPPPPPPSAPPPPPTA